MAIETTPVCEHGIRALTLSAWRDNDLPAAEASVIGAHVTTCAACQTHLAEYDAIIEALRSQPAPVASERLWNSVEAEAATTPQRLRLAAAPSSWRPGLTRNGRLVGTLATLAAVLLIVVGFVRVLTPQHHPTATTTTRPLPPLQLTWTPATLPPGMQLYGLAQPAPSPTNGNIVYACVSPLDVSGKPVPGVTGGATTVWETSDRAAHWTPVSTLPLARRDITLCAVLVDGLNPAHLLALATWQRQPYFFLDPYQSLAFASTDGGATWQPLANPQDTQITEFVTYGATTYALFAYTGSSTMQHLLYASDDGMRTWHPIDAPIYAADDTANQLWVQPDSGELLVVAGTLNAPEGKNITHLWTSEDGGVQWTRLSGVPDATGFTVLSRAGMPWTLCGTNFEKTANPNWPGALWCSTNGGRTWSQRPLPPLPPEVIVATPTSPAGSFIGAQTVAVSASGDLIAQVGLNANSLYRLVPGHSQWQSLGSAPSPYVSVFYAPDSGDGVLWAISGETSPDQATPTTPIPVQVFTTSYPPEP